jgi:hypothetical protein
VSRVALLACLASTLAGCGFGAGEEREGGARIAVTRDFGGELLAQAEADTIREGDTVMRLLRREREVETSFGGRFVQAIDGLAGQGADGRRDWFFWVNGLESSKGAADYELSPGDRVQWDYRDWSAAMRVPAIVGAFPEPFVSGIEGKRRPVRVECAERSSEACGTVRARLSAAGVAAGGAGLGTSGTENVIRVVVGEFEDVRLVSAVDALAEGPQASGVFARLDDDAVELLDEGGEAAGQAPRGTGVIAALAPSEEEIVWVVTAPDRRGVERAAARLDERSLRHAFAVAVGPAGVERLPLEAGE